MRVVRVLCACVPMISGKAMAAVVADDENNECALGAKPSFYAAG